MSRSMTTGCTRSMPTPNARPLPTAAVRVIVMDTGESADPDAIRRGLIGLLTARGRQADAFVVRADVARLGQGAGSGPRSGLAADRDRHVGRRTLDRGPSRPSLLKAIDARDHVIGRRPPGGGEVRAVAGDAPYRILFALPIGGHPLALPDPSSRRPGPDRPCNPALVPRRRDPGQGDLLNPCDRGGRRPSDRLSSRSRGTWRDFGPCSNTPSSSVATSLPPEDPQGEDRRSRRPRHPGRRKRPARPGWSIQRLRASPPGGR